MRRPRGNPWHRQTVLQCKKCGGKSPCRGNLWEIPKIELHTEYLRQHCPLSSEGWYYPLPPDERKQFVKQKPSISTTTTTTRTNTSPQGLLGILPPELFNQVLQELFPDGLLISTGCAVQFFSGRRHDKPIQIVQQMIPVNGGKENLSNTRLGTGCLGLAQTNRYWRDYVYSRLYGQNAFVFNVGITTHGVCLGSHDFESWASWTQALPFPLPSEEPPGPLGPLTARAAKWLRDVTLVITCPTSHGAREVARLEAEVRRAVETLRACERLESLQLCLQVCQRAGPGYDTQVYDTLVVDLLDANAVVLEDSESGRGRRRMKIEIREPAVEEPSRMNKLQKAFEPLLGLEGLAQKVVISGLMTREFFEKLSRTLSVGGGSHLWSVRCSGEERDSQQYVEISAGGQVFAKGLYPSSMIPALRESFGETSWRLV